MKKPDIDWKGSALYLARSIIRFDNDEYVLNTSHRSVLLSRRVIVNAKRRHTISAK